MKLMQMNVNKKTTESEDAISRGNNYLLDKLSVYFRRSKNNDSASLHERDSSSLPTVGIYHGSTGYRYKLGVIDFLTNYSRSKQLETKWNAVRHGKESIHTSCQHPKDYQQRFI